MRTATMLVVALALVLLAWGAAPAKKNVAVPTMEPAYSGDAGQARWPNSVFWFDDIEGDVSEWSTDDLSAGAAPHFHADTYMAYGDTGYSWWCGTFAYDADGGYGNSWDDRLDIPTTDVGSATYPILTYAFRHDSEPAYDFTYVQAESNGVFVDLNRGYDGVQPWTDLGDYGFVIIPYDNPFVARFRFISDGGWSDEDGDYMSVGGAFMCDNVKIYDYFGGSIYFYDDVNDGTGLCQPAVPSAAGDYWHVIDRACPALSDPHSWWCGDDADTSLVPPNLQNIMYSPLVDLSTALSCTVHFAMHFAMPTVDNDYVGMYGTSDGMTYNGIGGWWGDFGQCDGWGTTAYDIGFDIANQFSDPPYTWGGFAWIMYTTDNGCGPAIAGDAGTMIDDVWFEGVDSDPVQSDTWTGIKALYR